MTTFENDTIQQLHRLAEILGAQFVPDIGQSTHIITNYGSGHQFEELIVYAEQRGIKTVHWSFLQDCYFQWMKLDERLYICPTNDDALVNHLTDLVAFKQSTRHKAYESFFRGENDIKELVEQGYLTTSQGIELTSLLKDGKPQELTKALMAQVDKKLREFDLSVRPGTSHIHKRRVVEQCIRMLQRLSPYISIDSIVAKLTNMDHGEPASSPLHNQARTNDDVFNRLHSIGQIQPEMEEVNGGKGQLTSLCGPMRYYRDINSHLSTGSQFEEYTSESDRMNEFRRVSCQASLLSFTHMLYTNKISSIS